MNKHKITLEDGRYLIYYVFGEKRTHAVRPDLPSPNPKSEIRNHKSQGGRD